MSQRIKINCIFWVKEEITIYELTTVLTPLYDGLAVQEVVPELTHAEGEGVWIVDCPCCGVHEARGFKTTADISRAGRGATAAGP